MTVKASEAVPDSERGEEGRLWEWLDTSLRLIPEPDDSYARRVLRLGRELTHQDIADTYYSERNQRTGVSRTMIANALNGNDPCSPRLFRHIVAMITGAEGRVDRAREARER